MNASPATRPFAAAPSLAASREAIAHLGTLSVSASLQSDSILRSMSKPPGGTPYLATDEGNRALQQLLTAGLAWLSQAAKGVAPAAEAGVQLALPLA